MKIAFQGEEGAYSHEAIVARFGAEAEVRPTLSFDEVFESVVQGEAEMGLLPIENAHTGSIHEVYDLLLDYPCSITGEIFLGVRHALLGLPGSSPKEIEHVYSHPQALWQCAAFLEGLDAVQHACSDTAGAARWVSEQGIPDNGAIAGRLAAELYGLEVLRRDIATLAQNTTRFIVVGPGLDDESPSSPHVSGKPCKTSLVVELAHEPGALYGALAPFAGRGINLTKLESRPIRTRNWCYRFYLDFQGHRDEPTVRSALEQLGKAVMDYQILGSYPTEVIKGGQ